MDSNTTMEFKLKVLTKKLQTLMQAQSQFMAQVIAPTSPFLCDLCGMMDMRAKISR